MLHRGLTVIPDNSPEDASGKEGLGLSSSEQAYIALRDQILSGERKAGEPLKERDLCDELNVSRTPIREALRRLFADGLAEMRPRRSIIVSRFNEEELSEIFELGIVLESFVAGLAAKKASDADLNALRSLASEMEAVVAAGEAVAMDEYAKLDQAFHARIAQAARNPRITQILQQTVSLRLLMNVMNKYSHHDFEDSLSHHRMIISAIAARDSEWAENAMGSHIRTGRAAGVVNGTVETD